MLSAYDVKESVKARFKDGKWDGHGGEKCGDTRDRNGHTKQPNEQSVWLQS